MAFILLKLVIKMPKKECFKCQNWRLPFMKWTPGVDFQKIDFVFPFTICQAF